MGATEVLFHDGDPSWSPGYVTREIPSEVVVWTKGDGFHIVGVSETTLLLLTVGALVQGWGGERGAVA